ncbi:hypothetical protein BGZ54_009407 [Gamsiella multidivaricata]|nr:hypothetical protein BGZ54_009407 [Gamsiella multidivaricata]
MGIGDTKDVENPCGESVLSAPYEVMEQKYAISIGMDHFYRFGFKIEGLPDVEESAHRLSEPEEDSKPTLKPLMIPDIEKAPEFIAAKEEFMRARVLAKKL